MPVKQYYVPNMPDPDDPNEAAHTGFHGLIDKLRGLVGVHDVTVDHASKQVHVHLHEGANDADDYLPNIDQALYEFGQLPGYTGQA